MSDPIPITDPDDPLVDDFRDLSHADRRPDRPGGRGLVVAEGTVVVRRLLHSRYPVRALLGLQRRFDELRADLVGCAAPYFVAAPDVMAAVVGFHLNRGVLATGDRVTWPPAAVLLRSVRTVALLEGVGDHENLGSIFRNAAALGVGAVLLGPGCSDPLYRRSVRVSMGTVLLVPFSSLDGDWAAAVDLLHGNGFEIVALTPRAAATPLHNAALAGRRVAVLLGSEGPGLSDAALGSADLRVRIPMAPGVDSLNVATAGAIAFAEIARFDQAGSVSGPGAVAAPASDDGAAH